MRVGSNLKQQKMFRAAALAVVGAAALVCGIAGAAPPLPYPTVVTPGTAAEQALVAGNNGTTIVDGARYAEQGQSWIYRFPVAPGDRCRIELVLADANAVAPEIVIPGPDNKPIASKSEF